MKAVIGNVMKAVIGKSNICNDKFPKSLDINKEEITDKNYSSLTSFSTSFL